MWCFLSALSWQKCLLWIFSFLLFNICMWKDKSMLSDLCLFLSTVFFSLSCSVKERQETIWREVSYRRITREDEEPMGPSADNPCKLADSKAGIRKLKRAKMDSSRGREKGITRTGREELADVSCYYVRMLWLPQRSPTQHESLIHINFQTHKNLEVG